ncbi:hypothetical protein [Myxococcus sp. Y35]|uniref:hypothetical protein n=1 Tax=Pseudomyxococcus flavus TaxID=3115648 RepID=UPI003CEFFF19
MPTAWVLLDCICNHAPGGIVHSSKSVVTPSTRVRNWAVRAALLIACVGSIATSEDNTTSVSFSAQPFTLTTEQGRTTRHVTVRIAPQKEKRSGRISVDADVTARWIPGPSSSDRAPTLHLSWTHADQSGYSQPDSLSFVGHSTVPLTGRSEHSHWFDCEARQECLWEADLEFRLEGEAQGHVDISELDLQVWLSPTGVEEIPARDVGITIADR